jgi:pyruvate kinase
MAERRAKIVCTLGPASQDEATIAALLDAGMDGCRLNLSFGPPEEYEQLIARVRKVAAAKGKSVAIIADLPGRKIRVGALEGGRVDVLTGSTVTFQVDRGQVGHARLLPVDSGFFHENLIRGDQVLLSDGLVELEITAVREHEAEGRVLFGGVVAQSTGVHVPGMTVRGGLITDEDLPYLRMVAAQQVDYLALTYVTDGADILQARERLADMGASIPIIAKIERSEAFARLDGILLRADAIMVRRGDLGAQIEVTRVPLVQKEILRLAGLRGVPVIIATQMLGSMINAPTPTRAEASDVSNAVVDGADGLLLSAETAVGRFPVAATQMMDRIIEETEKERFEAAPKQWTETFDAPFADTTARIACMAARQTGARVIACFTESGRTARLVAKYRPEVPVVAFCRNEATGRRLQVVWGVETCQLTHVGNVERMVHTVEELLLNRGAIRRGDRLVIVFGAPVGEKGKTNSVRLHEVGRLAATGDLDVQEGSE